MQREARREVHRSSSSAAAVAATCAGSKAGRCCVSAGRFVCFWQAKCGGRGTRPPLGARHRGCPGCRRAEDKELGEAARTVWCVEGLLAHSSGWSVQVGPACWSETNEVSAMPPNALRASRTALPPPRVQEPARACKEAMDVPTTPPHTATIHIERLPVCCVRAVESVTATVHL